jgi:4-hydroxy-4-methyl-2-oxoglutarate aldolase
MSGEPTSPEILKRLKEFSTCAIANAIECLNVRLRNVGFGDSSVQCRFPHFSPVIGYAVTLRLHGANPPIEGGFYVDRTDWWDDLAEMRAPHIVVIEDADRRVGTAAFVGETHAAILQAMGCVAVVTNGAVRDLKQVELLGFQLFSGNVSVSHGYAHVARVDTPVRVAGLNIRPGELLHGDQHGIVKVPRDSVETILGIADRLRSREKEILRFCESGHFSREGLRNLLLKIA